MECQEIAEVDCDDVYNGANKNDHDIQDMEETPVVEESIMTQPVPIDEERELLQIVENHDRLERTRALNKVLPATKPRADLDDYWLASSRIMLRDRASNKDNVTMNLYDPDLLSTTTFPRSY